MPLLLSLKVAGWATALVLVAGVAIAWAVARQRFRGREVLDAVMTLPMVLPPTVLGYYLIVLLGRRGWLGAWLHEQLGVVLMFTWQGAVIAAAVVAFPLVYKAARAAFEGVSTQTENAARVLGATEWAVFVRITLPLAWRGILAGTMLAFARALGEFGGLVTRGGGADQRIRPGRRLHLSEDPMLDVEALGYGFLDPVRAGHGLFHRAEETQAPLGGQGRIELHYSVAEHCYHGAMYFLRRKRHMEAIAFLFHDAAEGLLKDIPRPVKKAIGHGYEVAEALLTIQIERKFGLREWASTVYETVKEIDNRILLNERAAVLRTPMDWGPAWEKVRRLDEDDFRPRFWPPEEAMRQWIAAAEVFAEDYPELLKLPKEA